MLWADPSKFHSKKTHFCGLLIVACRSIFVNHSRKSCESGQLLSERVHKVISSSKKMISSNWLYICVSHRCAPFMPVRTGHRLNRADFFSVISIRVGRPYFVCTSALPPPPLWKKTHTWPSNIPSRSILLYSGLSDRNNINLSQGICDVFTSSAMMAIWNNK